MNVVLTGACGGIGEAIARQLAAAGASLFLCDLNGDKLEQLGAELREQAIPSQLIETRQVDLMDDHQVDDWLESVKATAPVNVLINNAGFCRFGMFEQHADRDIELTMALNGVAPMKLTRKLLPVLRRQTEARVVNVASTFGAIGFPGYSVYSASKYAIRGFTQALARELADTPVRVGCILPRATRTALNSDRVVEMNRKLKVAMDPPEKVAQSLIRFLGKGRGELAIGWPEKLLVRLNYLFPLFIGKEIAKKLPLIKQYAA
jgi:short-subunit dehydrogenase